MTADSHTPRTAAPSPLNGTVRAVPRPGAIAAQARAGAVGVSRASAGQRAASRYQTIDDVIDARAVFPVFQPLVRADDRALVGYEALSRGPVGTPWESPVALFSAASQAGRLAELDWACRARISRGAIAAGLDSSTALFVNAEPSAIATPCPDDLRPAIVEATRRLRVVIELPERAVAADPAGLLTAALAFRDSGCSIALDDVGTNPAALSLLPLLMPDVVKLDLDLVRNPSSPGSARTINGVRAYAERTRATVVAEGVETAEHLNAARALGASVVQGFLTGRPGPLPEQSLPSLPPDAVRRSFSMQPSGTPFELLSTRQPVRRAGLDTLLTLSYQLEEAALDTTEPPVVLGCFPPDRFREDGTRTRLAQLASSAALVIAVGDGCQALAPVGVRGNALGPHDPLRAEWNVVVLGPHFAGALVARETGDPEPDRRFDYVLTYERSLVLHAARALLRCLAP